VITVYLVTTATITSSSHDQDHAPRRRQQLHVEDRVVGLFDGLPVVLYKLARRDFLRHGSLPGLSCHHHSYQIGADRLAALLGALDCFSHHRVAAVPCFVIDGDTPLTYTTIVTRTSSKGTGSDHSPQVGAGIGVGPRMKLSTLASSPSTSVALDEYLDQLECHGLS
jgi:hypothetical protein